MKRNNKNIIFDNDIIMTNGSNIGKSLDTILDNQEHRIASIESNTKWLYKYGGMGSGGGGSGSSETKWKTIVSCIDTGGTILKDGDTINFSGKGEYSFKVQIYNGGTSQYKISFDYRNSSGNQTITDVVSSTNSFSITKKFNFDVNANLNIIILNQDTFETITYKINYIVVSYQFQMYYVFADDHTLYQPDTNGDIYMSEVASRGIQAALDYSVNVGLQKSIYTYTNWEGLQTTVDFNDESIPGKHPIQPNKSEVIYLDLVSTQDIRTFLNNSDNASYREFTVDITLQLAGSEVEEEIQPLKFENSLIPTNLYLKVQSPSGSIYSVKPDDPSKYSKLFSMGVVGVFNITPSFGPRDNDRKYTLKVSYGTSPSTCTTILQDVELKDRVEDAVSIPITESGEHYVEFYLASSGASYTCGYYLNVKPLSETFSWYPSELSVSPTQTMVYRKNIEAKNITINSVPIDKTDTFNMTINSSRIDFALNDLSSSITNFEDQDQLVCIGIQYSAINDTDVPIIGFRTQSGKNSIYIYQNKILKTKSDSSITGDSVEIFIDKVDQMDIASTSKYHLIQIYKRFETYQSQSSYKSISIYIDGILEAVYNNFDTTHNDFVSMHLYPGNYYVNLMEYSCFEHKSVAEESSRKYLTDNDLLGYFYAYSEKILGAEISQSDRIIYEECGRFTRTDDNYIACTNSEIMNIALQSKVPVLVVKFTDTNAGINDKFKGYDRDNFKAWMETTYEEGDSIETLPVTLQWAPGNGSALQDINFESQTDTKFQITLQGSSSRIYRCKNFELMAPASDSSDYIFTPNFDMNNTQTFLPESSFTLKADVVDSSHSNNNTMGNFINRVSTKFSDAKQINNKYSNHIKNCLVGFPILVFLHTSYKESATSGLNRNKYYFLGIYNFNLGRNAYFNLGYKNLNLLNSLNIHEGFGIYSINSEDNAILNGIRIGEVQGNDNYFDFSQCSRSILFKDDTVENDTKYMYGDLIDGSDTTQTNTKTSLISVTQGISLAGGHIFDRIGKSYSESEDDHYGYDDKYSAVDSYGISKNQVPNYRHVAERTIIGTSNVYTFTPNPKTATEGSIEDLLIGNPNEGIAPMLNYESLAEYYTICMAFGLVDSVQKNLNFKSWNSGNTFYVAFYDMDTCLGIANDGSKIDYYAFSDYWLSQSVASEEVNVLKSVSIYRDFSPKSTDTKHVALYDVPSSYLFAVAKYAHKIISNEKLEMHPNNLWGKWRMQQNDSSDAKKGCLQDADTFINQYYKNHLAKVSASIFNFNYRYKYLVFSESMENYDSLNSKMFWGRKIAYTKNWINNRLHILDAYFNVNAIADKITSEIAAPAPDSKYVDSNNGDIYVLHDIFSDSSQGNQYGNLEKTITLRALPSSPIILVSPNSSERYLTSEDYSLQSLQIKTSGMQTLLIGGSSLWTYIDRIDPFITKTNALKVKSNNFTTLIGNSGECKTWSLTIPSIREVALTSAKYSGTLTFNASNPNLQKVNINNTAIILQINHSSLNTLYANNIQSGSKIEILNTDTLTDVQINGNSESVTIKAWKQTIYLPTNYPENHEAILNCQSINIVNNIDKYPHNELHIRNNSLLTTLTVKGFETLTVSGCPNLKKIIIEDSLYEGELKNNILKRINVSYADRASSELTIGSTTNVVDLSEQKNLNEVVFQNCAITEIKIGQNSQVYLPNSAFYGCTKLQYLNTLNSSKFYINGHSIFTRCNSFALKKDSSGNRPNMTMSSTVTSFDSMFEVDYSSEDQTIGQMTYSDATWFFNNVCINHRDNITNLAEMFRYQKNLSYLISDHIDQYRNQRCDFNLDYINVNNMDRMFEGTKVRFINRYMFKTLGKNASILSFEYAFPDSIQTTVDFLYEILDKIRSMTFTWNWDVGISFYDMNGSLLSEIPMFDVFHRYHIDPDTYDVVYDKIPKNLISITGFNVNSRQSVNLNSTFTSQWEQANIVGLTLQGFAGRQTMTIKEGTLENLFQDIKLKSIGWSFRFINYKNSLGNDIEVDLKKFINWDKIDTAINLFYDSSDSEQSLNFKKCVNGLEDFHYIWDRIIKARNLQYISYLFQNTKIYVDSYEDSNAFYLNSDSFRQNSENQPNRSIIEIPWLFDNMQVLSHNGKTLRYLSLTSNFLKYMPSITNFKGTFQNFALYNTLPYNFFNKRSQTIEDVFLEKVEIDPTTEQPRTIKVPGKLHEFDYTHSIVNLYRCFYNVKCRDKFEGFLSSETYNENSISDNYLAYYDRTTGIETPAMDVSCFYRSALPSASKEILTHVTEITDCAISTDYVNTVVIPADVMPNSMGEASQLFNYDVYTENRTKLNRLFVAPDILYGILGRETMLTEMFANDNDADSTFVGALPKNLFKASPNINFKNSFKNINILPQLFNSRITTQTIEEVEYNTHHYYYTFVPSGFTTNTSLDKSFNFRIFLPAYPDLEIEKHYCIMLNDSVPSDVISMNETLPNNGNEYLFVEATTESHSAYNFAKYNFGLNYSILDTQKYEEDEVTHEIKFVGTNSGINLNEFSSLKLDNLIYGRLMRVISGHIFNQSSWSGTGLLSRLASKYNYVLNSDSYGYLSKAITEIFPLNNNRFINAPGGGCSISKTTVSNFEQISTGSYPSINFI